MVHTREYVLRNTKHVRFTFWENQFQDDTVLRNTQTYLFSFNLCNYQDDFSDIFQGFLWMIKMEHERWQN